MPTELNLSFLYDSALDEENIKSVCKAIEQQFSQAPKCTAFDKREKNYTQNNLVFLMLCDSDFLLYFQEIAQQKITLCIISYKNNPLQQKEYKIPAKLEDALALASQENSFKRDNIIQCNGEHLLGSVKIGETDYSSGYKTLKNIFSYHLKPIHIETDKEQEIDTIALFIEIASEAFMQNSRANFFKESNNQCRRISAIFYAPQSILGALRLSFYLSKKRHISENLPASIGTIKTDMLRISTPAEPFFVSYNDKVATQTQSIEIQQYKSEAEVISGYEGCIPAEDKESIRMQNLPTDTNLITFFTKKALPLIPIAAESSFADLFTKLRSSAQIHTSYMLLLVVSVLMATIGLFQNSSPTIIGAMILAPLMAPIISFSMGAIRFDKALIFQSTKTIIYSILIALAASAFLAWALPFIHITQQMSMRTHPTLLDLAVAILSGIVAAYGYSNSKVGESLAGVAIAVALVPPLCVAGVGIGWESWQIFTDAFLLFLANIAGIVFAAGLMFYILGYSSTKYVSTAFVIKFLMLALIAIPLWVSSRSLIVDEKIYKELEHSPSIALLKNKVDIQIAKIEHKNATTFVFINLRAKRALTLQEKDKIAAKLKQLTGKDIKLIFSYETVY